MIVSVGAADEEELASLAAGVPFVRITEDNAEQAWEQVAALVLAAADPAGTPIVEE